MKIKTILSLILRVVIAASFSFSLFWLISFGFDNTENLHYGPIGIVFFILCSIITLFSLFFFIYNIVITRKVANRFNSCIRKGFKKEDVEYFEKSKTSLFYFPTRSLIYYCLGTFYLISNQIDKAEENFKFLLFNFKPTVFLPYFHLASVQLWVIAGVKEDEELFKKCGRKFVETSLTGKLNIKNKNPQFQRIEDAGEALKVGKIRSAIDLLDIKAIPFFNDYYEKGAIVENLDQNEK